MCAAGPRAPATKTLVRFERVYDIRIVLQGALIAWISFLGATSRHAWVMC